MRSTVVCLAKRQPVDFFALFSRSTVKPDRLSHLQTDGSFKKNISRTAALLHHEGETQFNVKRYETHKNSYESEWCSIVDGIQLAKKENAFALRLENDNLGVIQSLILKHAPKHEYVRSYYFYVLDEAKDLEWLDIRWIPRKMNKADALFR